MLKSAMDTGAEFIPRLDILPPPQRRLWSDLAAVPPEFVPMAARRLRFILGTVSRSTLIFLATALSIH
jgi:hypothetical protein